MNSLLTDNAWFNTIGIRLEIVNVIDGFVYFCYVKKDSTHCLSYKAFINWHYPISRKEETLLGKLERLSEYEIQPCLFGENGSGPEVNLSESYVPLGKRVTLNSLAVMADLEFEEILLTLTFTPELL